MKKCIYWTLVDPSNQVPQKIIQSDYGMLQLDQYHLWWVLNTPPKTFCITINGLQNGALQSKQLRLSHAIAFLSAMSKILHRSSKFTQILEVPTNRIYKCQNAILVKHKKSSYTVLSHCFVIYQSIYLRIMHLKLCTNAHTIFAHSHLSKILMQISLIYLQYLIRFPICWLQKNETCNKKSAQSNYKYTCGPKQIYYMLQSNQHNNLEHDTNQQNHLEDFA